MSIFAEELAAEGEDDIELIDDDEVEDIDELDDFEYDDEL
jgi:GTP-binding protein